jgi:nicotinamide riboside kinase
MIFGPPSECPWCKAKTIQARTPVTVYCTTCGSMWEFPTRIDPGVATTPEWAKNRKELMTALDKLLAENREWVRLVRGVKNAASNDESIKAVHELTKYAIDLEERK